MLDEFFLNEKVDDPGPNIELSMYFEKEEVQFPR